MPRWRERKGLGNSYTIMPEILDRMEAMNDEDHDKENNNHRTSYHHAYKHQWWKKKKKDEFTSCGIKGENVCFVILSFLSD